MVSRDLLGHGLGYRLFGYGFLRHLGHGLLDLLSLGLHRLSLLVSDLGLLAFGFLSLELLGLELWHSLSWSFFALTSLV